MVSQAQPAAGREGGIADGANWATQPDNGNWLGYRVIGAGYAIVDIWTPLKPESNVGRTTAFMPFTL